MDERKEEQRRLSENNIERHKTILLHAHYVNPQHVFLAARSVSYTSDRIPGAHISLPGDYYRYWSNTVLLSHPPTHHDFVRSEQMRLHVLIVANMLHSPTMSSFRIRSLRK